MPVRVPVVSLRLLPGPWPLQTWCLHGYPGKDTTLTLLDGADWNSKIFSNGWTSAQGGPTPGARAAQPEWAATIGPERAALMRRAARVLEDNHEEFETWLVREGGAVPGKAAFEVQLVLGELWEAAALPTQPWGQLLPSSEPGRESIARRVPLGVVGVISPWNFPLILSVRAGGARARAGQRGHTQAGRADAGVGRRPGGPALRGGRPARGPAARAAGRRRGRRRPWPRTRTWR